MSVGKKYVVTLFVVGTSFALSILPYFASDWNNYRLLVGASIVGLCLLYVVAFYILHKKKVVFNLVVLICGVNFAAWYVYSGAEWIVGAALTCVVLLCWRVFNEIKYYGEQYLKSLWLFLLVAESCDLSAWIVKVCLAAFNPRTPRTFRQPALSFWYGMGWYVLFLACLTLILAAALYYRRVIVELRGMRSDESRQDGFYVLLSLPFNFLGFLYSTLAFSYGHVSLRYNGKTYGFVRDKNKKLIFQSFTPYKSFLANCFVVRLPARNDPEVEIQNLVGMRWSIFNNCFTVADAIVLYATNKRLKTWIGDRLCVPAG